MHRQSEEEEKDTLPEWIPKENRITIFTSNNIDFKIKIVTRDRDDHYIMIKGSINQEDKAIVNMCAPNTGAPKYIQHILIDHRGEINSNTVITGNLYITAKSG